jgi:hypothetical protein
MYLQFIEVNDMPLYGAPGGGGGGGPQNIAGGGGGLIGIPNATGGGGTPHWRDGGPLEKNFANEWNYWGGDGGPLCI